MTTESSRDLRPAIRTPRVAVDVFFHVSLTFAGIAAVVASVLSTFQLLERL